MNYRNLAEVHRRQAERLGPRPALRYKQNGLYHDVSWTQYRNEALACGAALLEAGVKPGDRVGLLAENRLEWLIADMGILAAGAINVAPHCPLTARQVHFQFDDAGVTWAFASTTEQLEKIRQIRHELPALRGIVVFDGAAVTANDQAANVTRWSSFLQHSREYNVRQSFPFPRRECARSPHHARAPNSIPCPGRPAYCDSKNRQSPAPSASASHRAGPPARLDSR